MTYCVPGTVLLNIPDRVPLLLQLSIHDVFVYSKISVIGGSLMTVLLKCQ